MDTTQRVARLTHIIGTCINTTWMLVMGSNPISNVIFCTLYSGRPSPFCYNAAEHNTLQWKCAKCCGRKSCQLTRMINPVGDGSALCCAGPPTAKR
jgi:hypothetical protein